ncbi:NUDIX hydrolase [Streptomyces avicenniae]|uniref:NUDIX hydrolase n=1 Tax=Streptomyces avicenniae TaxID=500153 RepID=UPI00069A3AF4|nr:NUDIX domain-containing protein [Streptomyces avicenniae]
MIDKIAWINIANGRILSTRSKGRERYYLPGGKREAGESDLDTLAREIKEELSVELRLDTARFVGEFRAQADAHPDGVEVRMRCYESDYEGQLSPASEIAEMIWLQYADRPLTSAVDQIIFDHLLAEGRIR